MRAFWAEDRDEKNTELCFATCVKRYENAEIRLIAKDVYNLFVNGEFVHYGPARTAKGYARVDRIEIGKYLTQEKNVISVYVQSLNTQSLCFTWEEPLFGAELYSGGKLCCDASEFRCFAMTDKLIRVERMSSQRGFLEIYNMSKSREPFDFSSYPELKKQEKATPVLLERNVGYSTNEEIFAEEYEEGGVSVDETRVWKNDFTDLLDGIGKEALFGYTRKECEYVLSKRLVSFVYEEGRKDLPLAYRAYRFDRVRCGKFKITLKVRKPSEIYLVYDDYLIDGKIKFNRQQIIHGLKWTLAEGEYELYSEEVYTAKYIALVADGAVDFGKVSVISVENGDTKNFSLECADASLRDIVLAAQHSFEQNAYDLFTDCPSRERAGWLCDSYFTAKAEKFFTGDNRVERNFLENYALYKNERFGSDGVLPMCYPSEPKSKDSYIPNWILWFVLELGDRLERTGETLTPTLKKKVESIVEFFASYENEYGLLEDLEGWVFLEWSKAGDFMQDVNFPSNMLYCGMLEAAGRLLKRESLVQKAAELKETIRRLAFDGEFFMDNAVRVDGKLQVQKNVSETCQYFAMFFNILTKAEAPEFYAKMFDEFGAFRNKAVYPEIYASNMFIGYVVRLTLLAREEEYALLLRECRRTFADMARETGTIWELFSQNASCNHGFGSIVAKLVCEALTGFVGCEDEEKRIVFSEKFSPLDTRLQLPIRDGVIVIKIKDGIREVDVPNGYEMIIRK